MNLFHQKLNHIDILLTQYSGSSNDSSHHHDNLFQINIPILGDVCFEHGPTNFSNVNYTTIKPNQSFVLPPYEQHNHFSNETAKILIVKIQADFIQKMIEGNVHKKLNVEFKPKEEINPIPLLKLISDMITTSLNPEEKMEVEEFEIQFVYTLLTLLLGSHSEEWNHNKVVYSNDALKRAIELIYDEYMNNPSLDQISEQAQISKSHLMKLFHDNIGKTPNQLLSQLKLKHAENLLRTTEQDISMIALDSGYGSFSSFYRSFRNKHGIHPSEYRKK